MTSLTLTLSCFLRVAERCPTVTIATGNEVEDAIGGFHMNWLLSEIPSELTEIFNVKAFLFQSRRLFPTYFQR
jgi:hypothetical protein